MRPFLVAFIGIVVNVNIASAQKVIYTKAEINAARVYQQGAELTATAKASVTAGQQEIIFEGLSNFVDPQSVQVYVNNETTTILSATFQHNYIKAKEKNPIYKGLKDSLDDYLLQLSRVSNQKGSLQEEQSLILSNKIVSGQNTGLNVAELQKASEFLRTRINTIRNEIYSLEQKENKLREIVNKYRQQISDIENTQKFPAGELSVIVDASVAASSTFRLTYYVSQAGWNPIYDIRVKNVGSQPVLQYKANIYQNTGTDWKNARLTLSTGNPAVPGFQPVLSTWFLDFYQPRINVRGSRSEAMSVPSMAMDKMSGAVEEDASIAYQNAPQVSVTENQLSVEFQIANPYDIPSDGKNHLVAIQEHQLKATYKYYAAPKLSQTAYLLAKITDWEKLQLLPGNANIFFEGAFTGQTYIQPMAGDTLDLSLGRDEKIIIKRETIQDFEKEKIVGSNKRQTFGYDFSVKNSKSSPIEIEILDQIPVSKHSEIEIKAEELSMGNLNPTTGIVKWTYTIQPAETKKWKFSYSVKSPKDRQLNY